MMLTASLVRALRGAPVTVLLLMMIERRPLTLGYIRRHTGYTDKVIHDAVMLLQDYGMAVQTGRYTWQLAAGVQQLPLMNALPEPPDPQPETEPGEDPVDVDPSVEEEQASTPRELQDKNLGRNNSDLNPLASSGFNQILDSGDPLLPDSRAPARSEKIRANLQALDEHGIREPARTRLARLEHVTPRLIDYHCRTAQSPGLAIYRIEHGWRVPADWSGPEEISPPDPAPEAPAPELPPVSTETLAAWRAAVDTLAGEVSRADFETWVRSAWPAGMDGGVLVIGTGNVLGAAWLEQHVKRRLEELTGCAIRIEVRHG